MLELLTVSEKCSLIKQLFFALFLYKESVMKSSLTYNVFNIHIKYKVQTCQPWIFFLSTTCVMAMGGGYISYVVYIICSVRITLFMLNISQRSALSHILQLHDSG